MEKNVIECIQRVVWNSIKKKKFGVENQVLQEKILWKKIVEFHQKEKVWCGKLGNIRKNPNVKETPKTSEKKNNVSKLSFKTLEVQSLWIINL